MKLTDVSRSVRKILDKHWPLIANNNTLKEIFPSKPMLAYSNHKSMKNLLVRSKLPTLESTCTLNSNAQTLMTTITGESLTQNVLTTHRQASVTSKTKISSKQSFNETKKLFHERPICQPCCAKNCTLCTRLRFTNFVKSKQSGSMFHIKYEGLVINCRTPRVVYLIECNKCGKQ